jgi:hypothetical protein
MYYKDDYLAAYPPTLMHVPFDQLVIKAIGRQKLKKEKGG